MGGEIFKNLQSGPLYYAVPEIKQFKLLHYIYEVSVNVCLCSAAILLAFALFEFVQPCPDVFWFPFMSVNFTTDLVEVCLQFSCSLNIYNILSYPLVVIVNFNFPAFLVFFMK